MLASTLSPSLISSSLSSSSSLPSTFPTSTIARPPHPHRFQRACPQRERQLAFHILRSPFTISSASSMADQHQTQPATYPFLLDSSVVPIDISGTPQGIQFHDQGRDQGLVQGQVRVSPDTSSATQAAFMYFPNASHPHFTNQLNQGSQTAHIDQELTLNPAQLRVSSIGPNRVLTRRQARMHGAQPYESTPQEHHRQEGQQISKRFGLLGADANSPRPQTPNGFHTGAQFASARMVLPDLDLGQIAIPSAPAMSPQHPSTPASVTSSSNVSHYGFAQYPHSRHSRSDSNSTQPRSASPAASVVSAVTSHSSKSKRRPKSHRSRHPVSPASTEDIPLGQVTTSPVDVSHPKPKPKHRLSNMQRKDICQYFKDHPNTRQEDIATMWGVERSTISKILKHKGRWLAVSDAESPHLWKQRPPKFASVETVMDVWLSECRQSKTPITDAMIRTRAREIATRHGISEEKFKASSGWIENYKQRNGIKRGIWVGRPDPGYYSGDDTDEDRLLLHDYLKQSEREEAFQKLLESERQQMAPSQDSFMGESDRQQMAPSQGSFMGESGTPIASAPAGQSPVSPEEAKAAMDVILSFLQAQNPDFLTEKEMNILTDVRHLIWVTANTANQQAMTSSVANSAPNAATSAVGGASGINNVADIMAHTNAVSGGQLVAA